jgi:23S rRNA (cytosine1962-C5)-methyltransferase
MSYSLLDSGGEQKLERFGKYTLVRPCSQALWKPKHPTSLWQKKDALFTREGGNRWVSSTPLPSSWVAEIKGLKFKISPTEFGHVGVFPEHSMLWEWMSAKIASRKEPPNILNLFAYSGGASLACARAGARVCHLDASKGMVAWARENAALNELTDAPIRWIVEDVMKFLGREFKRGVRYDGIILDPPSFGRGSKGEIFKIENDLHSILESCKNILSAHPLFLVLTSHTPGFTPLVLHHVMRQMMEGKIEYGEMIIGSEHTFDLPCGSYARWSP